MYREELSCLSQRHLSRILVRFYLAVSLTSLLWSLTFLSHSRVTFPLHFLTQSKDCSNQYFLPVSNVRSLHNGNCNGVYRYNCSGDVANSKALLLNALHLWNNMHRACYQNFNIIGVAPYMKISDRFETKLDQHMRSRGRIVDHGERVFLYWNFSDTHTMIVIHRQSLGIIVAHDEYLLGLR